MTSRKDTSKDSGGRESHMVAGALGGKQKKNAITAAMEQSKRGGSMEITQRGSPALGRAVEAAQRGRKKRSITGALDASQRETRMPRKPESSEVLERKVEEKDRLRKKAAITAAMKESQRRSAPGES